MAGGSLIALIDDIATILDDVSILTKVAAKKTAGVLGDDLALNAQQVSGVNAERELPVVWAVAKGSFWNKCILVPAALFISWIAPWLITPLLMVGGAFLCFEGFEKIAHHYFHHATEDEAHEKALMEAVQNPEVDLVALEKDKIKGAIRTDFVLSAEIIVITLGTVQAATFMTKLSVLVGISLIMTVGVYGLVAGIVKLDDAGLYLLQQKGQSAWLNFKRWMGEMILRAAPYLMKTLSIVGTAAMFLVGGGILAHGIPAFHHGIAHLAESTQSIAMVGGILKVIVPLMLDGLLGILAGALVLLGINSASKLTKSFKKIESK